MSAEEDERQVELDLAGNPWPGCSCGEERYFYGHAESCPCFGLPPDRPASDEPLPPPATPEP